jgi:hypothetical protein
MSEFMFGARNDGSRRQLTDAQVRARDRACKAEGGYGYTYHYNERHEWVGWFAAPNYGFPFDRSLESAVLSRVEPAK